MCFASHTEFLTSARLIPILNGVGPAKLTHLNFNVFSESGHVHASQSGSKILFIFCTSCEPFNIIFQQPQSASTMASRFLLTLLLVVSSALANVCTNVTVPVTINAQQPHYTGPEILTKADATLFAQDFTRIANNAVDKYASGERNVTGTYDIGATFCTPDNSSSAKSALQFLTHGIGFDRRYSHPFIPSHVLHRLMRYLQLLEHPV